MLLAPMSVLLTVQLSSRDPASTQTFGPTVEPVSTTSSSMYTGSMIVQSSTSLGRRASPLFSITRLVSSRVSILPASYQPATSSTLSLAPWSIMYWKASVR